MMMASSIILQRCRRFYYDPKSSLIRSYSLIAIKSYASLSSFEQQRSRMQIVSDTTWSSSQQLLPSQVSPWLMLTPKVGGVNNSEQLLYYEFYDIGANKVMSFDGDGGGPPPLNKRRCRSDAFKGSSHGWLAEFDRSTRDLSLYNPISHRRVKLPTMDILPLRGSPGEEGGAIDMNDTEKYLSECIVKKVIISSSDPYKDESCVAMMLYGAGNRLACCHPAAAARGGGRWYPLGSRHWQWDDDGKRTAVSYQGVVYSAREKLFFCITKDDELEAWDSTALRANDMPISINDYSFKGPPRREEREFYLKEGLCSKHRERYLVVAEPYHHGSSSQLFLVLRHKMRLMDDGEYCDDEGWEKYSCDLPLQTLAFDDYKFDVEKRELVHMDRTLDGLALFVGKNNSFAVKADEFDGGRLKPDSIYFTDSDPQYDYTDLNQYGGQDNGVYNYEDGTFSSCYYPSDDDDDDESSSYERMVLAHIWFSPIDHKLPHRQAFSLVSSSYFNKTTTSIVRDDDPISKPPYNCLLITRRILSAASSSSSSTTVITGKKVAGHSISPPWLMLSAEMELSSGLVKFYSVAEDKVISIDRKNLKAQLGLESEEEEEEVKLECRGSSHGWLVLFDRCSSGLFLYNPLSNRHLKLPSIRKLEAIPDKDLKTGFSCVNKLIISSSDPEGDVNCRALMIYGRWNNLAYCCPNSSSSSNEWVETYHRYEDVACCGDNNLFLCVNDDKPSGSQWHYPEFEGWDLRDVSRPILISLEDRLVKDFGKTFPWKGYGPKKDWMSRDANFFVTAAADDVMYYVCLNSGNWDMHKDGDYHFHVHRFDFESGKLVHMDRSLDGLAFFVGRNHSFALSAHEFPGLQPDSIYFTHQEDYRDYPFGRKHVKAYNYRDGTFETKNIYTLKDDDKMHPKPPDPAKRYRSSPSPRSVEDAW